MANETKSYPSQKKKKTTTRYTLTSKMQHLRASTAFRKTFSIPFFDFSIQIDLFG